MSTFILWTLSVVSVFSACSILFFIHLVHAGTPISLHSMQRLSSRHLEQILFLPRENSSSVEPHAFSHSPISGMRTTVGLARSPLTPMPCISIVVSSIMLRGMSRSCACAICSSPDSMYCLLPPRLSDSTLAVEAPQQSTGMISRLRCPDVFESFLHSMCYKFLPLCVLPLACV